MSRLKVAVVGVGALGRHHARILGEMPSADLVAVAETNPETGKRVADACDATWVADYRELCDRVDAVSIAVPTSAHLAVASEFLERRIPLFVEKPLAANVAEAQQLVDAAARNQTIVQVGHVERYNPATVAARQVCGKPSYIRAERLSPYSFRSTDIGVVHDLMIHDLDLVLDFVDAPVCHVEAFGLSVIGGHEDVVQARIVFENGCIADLTASRVNPTAQRSMQIWSSSGTVTVDFASREVVCYRPSHALKFGKPLLERAAQPDADVEQLKADVFGKFIEVVHPAVAKGDALTAELADFIDCVLANRQPLVGGREALRAMQVAERVLNSVETHQWQGQARGAVGPFPQLFDDHKLAG
jgi:predicted dehydrogenase